MENPKQVYIVTYGCYSEYSIQSVFESLEDASDYIMSKSVSDANDVGGYGYRIEVYDIGTTKERSYTSLFHVEMKEDRSLVSINIVDVKPDTDFAPIVVNGSEKYSSNRKRTIEVRCFAKDEKHAIKITSEKLTEVKALNLWNVYDL